MIGKHNTLDTDWADSNTNTGCGIEKILSRH
jgi:hypothetical protein